MTLPAPLPVRLHHLTAGAATAGEHLPDLELTVATAEELRQLLAGLARIAAGPLLPRGTAPEIRIRTTREELIVRIGGGGLRVISWESPLGGSPMSVDRILESVQPRKAPPPRPPDRPVDVVMREEEEDEDDLASTTPWLKVVLLSVAILTINGITAWLLLRPTPDLLPEHVLMGEPDASRFLRSLAGEFETGSKPGDRLLHVAPTGFLRLATYGRNHEIHDETTQVARAARAGDRPILVTNEKMSLEVRDSNTIVVYGTTYRRRR